MEGRGGGGGGGSGSCMRSCGVISHVCQWVKFEAFSSSTCFQCTLEGKGKVMGVC